jgi:hypothetical protein
VELQQLLGTQDMFQRYDWSTADYADAFQTLLRCSAEVATREKFLEQLVENRPAGEVAIDWGAGSGDLSGLLLEQFDRVIAVEPSEEMRKLMNERYPQLEVVNGDVRTAVPPVQVDLAVMSHVLYHIPDAEWLDTTIRVADFLTASGTLVVFMKNAESGCNRMLEHFGAPRFDVRVQYSGSDDRRSDFQFEFEQLPAGIRTNSFEDTLKIARFMMCDRESEAFRSLPSEDVFQNYVRAEFWDEQTGYGGWSYDLVICLIRRRL